MIMAWCRQNPFNHAFFCSCTEDDLGPWSESNRQERQRSLLSPFTYYQGGVSPQTTHRVTKSGTRLQRLGTQSINKGRKIQEDSRHEECCDGRELGWRDRESPGATEVWVAEEGLI